MIESLTCPHCHKQIELVGQRTLRDEYQIGPSAVALAKQRGYFPDPVLDFRNRKMWLRDDIEQYAESVNHERIDKLAVQIEQYIARLSEKEQARVRALIASGNQK